MHDAQPRLFLDAIYYGTILSILPPDPDNPDTVCITCAPAQHGACPSSLAGAADVSLLVDFGLSFLEGHAAITHVTVDDTVTITLHKHDTWTGATITPEVLRARFPYTAL